jgi:hypothetical protein
MPSARTGPNLAAVGVGAVALAVFAVLYAVWPRLYLDVLRLWAFFPFPYPFIDLIYLGAEVECWGKGIDVYLTCPCDPLDRVYDYAPILLRMPFLVVLRTWPNTVGLVTDGLFVLSLAALPRPRDPADARTALLCIVSPMTVFALERGNLDVIIFEMTMLALTCLGRGRGARLVGYAVILVASLLKFYPFVLFALLRRERPWVAAIIGMAAVAGMAASLWPLRNELASMAANIPHPSVFTDSFGAGQLPEGFGLLMDTVLDPTGSAHQVPAMFARDPHLYSSVYAALVSACLIAVWRLARRSAFRNALCDLTAAERTFLLAGALLVCGCFFAGRSIGYREITILPALPGLLALARLERPAAGAFRVAAWLAVFLLWFLLPQRLVYGLTGGIPGFGGTLPGFAFWLCREIGWWCLATILLATLVCALSAPKRSYFSVPTA